jgi:hypothetical protein
MPVLPSLKAAAVSDKGRAVAVDKR